MHCVRGTQRGDFSATKQRKTACDQERSEPRFLGASERIHADNFNSLSGRPTVNWHLAVRQLSVRAKGSGPLP
ncbi:MAG: hypothetical protein CMJ78_07240 [Planctomycetaceae bacterium]|nr:hypothetical protein [Planctomycetaceae bacterium]